ncbi:MAG: hypothetical protein AAGJ46_20715, partial [Planctomycetota bacterium]
MIYREHGLRIDVAAIACGVLDMMPESETAPLALGMIPKKWADIVEQQLTEKVRSVAAEQRGFDSWESMRADYARGAAILGIPLNDRTPAIVSDIMQAWAREFIK